MTCEADLQVMADRRRPRGGRRHERQIHRHRVESHRRAKVDDGAKDAGRLTALRQMDLEVHGVYDAVPIAIQEQSTGIEDPMGFGHVSHRRFTWRVTTLRAESDAALRG
jgi:hypothetical protein